MRGREPCSGLTASYSSVHRLLRSSLCSQVWTLMSFLFQRLVEGRVRVHIPHSVQTHKTLTSSLCRLAAGAQDSLKPISGSKISAQCFCLLWIISGVTNRWRTKSGARTGFVQCRFAANWCGSSSKRAARARLTRPFKHFWPVKTCILSTNRIHRARYIRETSVKTPPKLIWPIWRHLPGCSLVLSIWRNELPTLFITMVLSRRTKQRVNPNSNTERRTVVTAQAWPT